MTQVLSIGIDLVEIERVARLHRRHAVRFLRRFAGPDEIGELGGKALDRRLGGLFAAKEAVLKALGTGWAAGLGFRQIEIVPDSRGAPRVRLHGAAAARAADLGVRSVEISITHEKEYAAAVAVALGRPAGADENAG